MTIKKVFFRNLWVISLILVSCLKDSSTHTSEIEAVLRQQVDGWNKGKIEDFMEGYDHTDSLQFITKKGRTMGWQNVLDRYRKSYPTKKEMGTLNFDNLVVKDLSGNLAQVYGNWHVVKDSTYSGNFSLIMTKKPEGWRIIIDHTW